MLFRLLNFILITYAGYQMIIYSLAVLYPDYPVNPVTEVFYYAWGAVLFLWILSILNLIYYFFNRD